MMISTLLLLCLIFYSFLNFSFSSFCLHVYNLPSTSLLHTVIRLPTIYLFTFAFSPPLDVCPQADVPIRPSLLENILRRLHGLFPQMAR